MTDTYVLVWVDKPTQGTIHGHIKDDVGFGTTGNMELNSLHQTTVFIVC